MVFAFHKKNIHMASIFHILSYCDEIVTMNLGIFKGSEPLLFLIGLSHNFSLRKKFATDQGMPP